jgi:hypothetical protein
MEDRSHDHGLQALQGGIRREKAVETGQDREENLSAQRGHIRCVMMTVCKDHSGLMENPSRDSCEEAPQSFSGRR